MLKRLPAEAKEEVTRLRRLLSDAEERASLATDRASTAAAKVVEAFKKMEDFHRELLESS